MNDDSYLWNEPLLVTIDLLYQISDPNDMIHEFFERLGKLIPFDAAIFNLIDWGTFELREGISFGNTNLTTLDKKNSKILYESLHFDLICLTQLNVSLKLHIAASNNLFPIHKPERKRPYLHTVSIIAGCRQNPVAAIRLFRQDKSSDFSDQEAKILDRLAVHVANAICLQSKETALKSAEQTGLMVFDANGNVLYMNGFTRHILAKIPLDSVLQAAQNEGNWLKVGMELYRVENVPLTPNSLLALYAKNGKSEEVSQPKNDIKTGFLETHGLTIISIKPFQRRSAIESRLERIGLSRREIDVTLNVMRGLSNSKIAEQMFIDETTVKDHLQHIYAKIKIKSRTELISKLLGLDIELAKHEIPVDSDSIRRII